MARRLYPANLLSNSADADGHPLTVGALGVEGTDVAPVPLSWSAIPYLRADIIPGTLEFYPDGSIWHDDHGDTSPHPAPGVTTTPVVLTFRSFDNIELSDDIGHMPVSLTGALTGDVTAPVFSSLVPAVGSTGNLATTDIRINFDESLQEGVGTFDIYDVGTGLIIESFAIPADLGMGDGTVHISGSGVVVNPTGALSAGTNISVRWTAGAVKDMAGIDCAAHTGDSIAFTTDVVGPSAAFPDDPDGWRGQEATFAYPTAGDHIVDATGAGDFVDLSGAAAVATAGQSIRIKATGIYREAVTLPDGVTVTGWGTDKPLFSAQEPLTGFVQCTSADATLLGSVLGVNGNPSDGLGPVYVRTGIPKSATSATNLVGLNPMEDHVQLYPSVDRANLTRIWSQEDDALAHDAGANGGGVTLSGTTVVGVTDPTVITAARYTNAQLLAAKIRIIVSPNEYPLLNVTAANVAANSITIDGGRTKDAANRQKYALINVGPMMVPGTFFFVDQGATFDLYVRPLSAANIDKISIAARAHILTVPDAATSMYIGGLAFEGASGEGPTEGSAIRKVSNGVTASNITIENCHLNGFLNVSYQHNSAIHILRADNTLVQFNTFEYCSGHGFFLNGSLVTSNNCILRRNVFRRVGSAAAKAYRLSNFALMLNLLDECGFRAHGNISNVYVGGLRPMFWSNEAVLCQGYYTVQDVVDWLIGFNHAPTDSKFNVPGLNLDNRKIYPQGSSGTGYALNNGCHCIIDGLANGGHVAMNPTDPGMTAYSYNNVTHGHTIPQDATGATLITGFNLITHDGFSGALGGNIDPSDFTGAPGKFSTTDQLELDLAAIYADYANRDWSPAGPASKLLTMGTFDIQSIVDAWWAANPALPIGDKSIDPFGNTINYAALKVGERQLFAA